MSTTPVEDNTTSLALPSFACRFVRRKCTHDSLFHDSYLRTNRTNHTKIMRCFPHCCPGHRKRSYCGSPIHIQLDQAMDSTKPSMASDDLVVYARFRPTSVKPLTPGDSIAAEAIESGLQRVNPSQGEWIEADLSYTSTDPGTGTISWCFEVNASGRWYYPWSGAATIALRATDHVFEVIVFQRQSKQKELSVLASVTSSTFRLMSFRRGVTNAATKDASSSASVADDQVSVSSKDGETNNTKSDDSTQAISPKRKRSAEAKQSSTTKPKTVKKTRVAPTTPSQASTTTTPTPQAATLKTQHSPLPSGIFRSVSVSRAPSPTTSVSPEQQHYTHRQLSPATEDTSTLGTLLQWLQELPSNSAGSRRLREWEHIVLDAAVAHLNTTQPHHRNHSNGLIPILSALQMTGSSSSSSASMAVIPASPLDLIDACVRMFLHLFLEGDCNHLGYDLYQCRTNTTTSNAYSSSQAALSSSCREWTRDLESRAARFIQLRTNVSWANLMATVDTLRFQRAAQGPPPPSADVFGYRSFVAQCRERSVRRQLQDAEMTKRRRHALPSHIVPVFAADPRVWTCRMDGLSIEMDGMSQHSLSLLTMLQFWRHLSCLRIDYQSPTSSTNYESQAAQLSLASVFNTSVDDECFTRLTLDGQYRWFGCLPIGDATTGTTLMGFVVGDYVGRATSAGTIHVTTYLWPQDAGVEAYACHWTLDARSLHSNNTFMNVIVEKARVHDQRALPFDTMSIHDKLRCVGRWDHVSQVQLAYSTQ